MLKDVRVLRFYTEEPEPLKTNTPIKFVLEYDNTGSTRVSSVPAKIHLGKRQVKNVTLPGIDAGKINRINLVLTNNITEELGAVGVSISDKDTQSAFKNYTWIGTTDVRFRDIVRDMSEPLIQVEDEVYGTYKVSVANYGTKPIKEAELTTMVQYKTVGKVKVNIDARSMINLSFPIRRRGGLTTRVDFLLKVDGKTIATSNQSIITEKLENDVEIVRLSKSKSTYELGEPAELTLTARNNSEYPIANLKVSVDNETTNSSIGTFTFNGLFEPNEERTRKIQINAGNLRSARFKFTLDPDNDIRDIDKKDNEQTIAVKWNGGTSNLPKPLGNPRIECIDSSIVFEQFSIHGFWPNAHHIAVSINGEDWREYQGDTFERKIVLVKEGKNTIRVVARNTKSASEEGSESSSRYFYVDVTNPYTGNNVTIDNEIELYKNGSNTVNYKDGKTNTIYLEKGSDYKVLSLADDALHLHVNGEYSKHAISNMFEKEGIVSDAIEKTFKELFRLVQSKMSPAHYYALANDFDASIDWSKLIEWDWNKGLKLGIKATFNGKGDFGVIGQFSRPLGTAPYQQLLWDLSKDFDKELKISKMTLAYCAVAVAVIVAVLTGGIPAMVAAGEALVVGGLQKVIDALQSMQPLAF